MPGSQRQPQFITSPLFTKIQNSNRWTESLFCLFPIRRKRKDSNVWRLTVLPPFALCALPFALCALPLALCALPFALPSTPNFRYISSISPSHPRYIPKGLEKCFLPINCARLGRLYDAQKVENGWERFCGET